MIGGTELEVIRQWVVHGILSLTGALSKWVMIVW